MGDVQWRQYVISSRLTMDASGSFQAGRIRLDFVSGASSESWESFTTRIVTVKYYHSKASISRIAIVQARQSSTIGHHPPRLPRRRRFIRSPRGGALIRFYGLLRRLTKMSQADWPKPLEFSGCAARTCRVGAARAVFARPFLYESCSFLIARTQIS